MKVRAASRVGVVGLSSLLVLGALGVSRGLGVGWQSILLLTFGGVGGAVLVQRAVRQFVTSANRRTRRLFGGVLMWLGTLPSVAVILAILGDASEPGQSIDAPALLGTVVWLITTYLFTMGLLRFAVRPEPGHATSRRVGAPMQPRHA